MITRRFIPAGTGNSDSSCPSYFMSTVHPRRYGELIAQKGDTGNTGGSSPQVRGTQIPFFAAHNTTRFIPAGTGNSAPILVVIKSLPVHPRRYGELHPETGKIGSYDGSSPQVRGTLQRNHRINGHRRFIPAGTGNSISWRLHQSVCAVHPRRYGELNLT